MFMDYLYMDFYVIPLFIFHCLVFIIPFGRLRQNTQQLFNSMKVCVEVHFTWAGVELTNPNKLIFVLETSCYNHPAL